MVKLSEQLTFKKKDKTLSESQKWELQAQRCQQEMITAAKYFLKCICTSPIHQWPASLSKHISTLVGRHYNQRRSLEDSNRWIGIQWRVLKTEDTAFVTASRGVCAAPALTVRRKEQNLNLESSLQSGLGKKKSREAIAAKIPVSSSTWKMASLLEKKQWRMTACPHTAKYRQTALNHLQCDPHWQQERA